MNECVQNTTVVYNHPSHEDKELLSRDQLREFLLNNTFFSEAYIIKNKNFLSYLDVLNLPFTIDSMLAFIEHKQLIKQTVSPATVQTRKYQMKKICHELILINPDKWTLLDQFRLDAFFSRINAGSLQKQAIPHNKILTKAEVDLLLKKASREWKLILLFLASTGVRVSELISITRPRCIRTEKDVQIKVTGKRGKQRFLMCSLKLFDAVSEYFPSRKYLFCTSKGTQFSRQHIWRGCNRLGIAVLNRPVGVHTFRHSFATQMINKGIDLKRVSEFLGHSGTAVTNDMYVHPEALGVDEIPDFGDII